MDKTAPKFLCDQMVLNLGRWLRAAGYDTTFAPRNAKDRELLAIAEQEERVLITCDRHFLELTKQNLIYLNSHSLLEQIKELNQKFQVNWLFHPFSRCLICNTPFVEASEGLIQKLAPLKIQQEGKIFWYCSHCDKIFWEGSHTQRMKEQLQTWNN